MLKTVRIAAAVLCLLLPGPLTRKARSPTTSAP